MGAMPTPPKIPPPPPPPDETRSYFRLLARQNTDAKLRQSKGRGGMFGKGYLGGDTSEAYRAPGMNSLMGGGNG